MNMMILLLTFLKRLLHAHWCSENPIYIVYIFFLNLVLTSHLMSDYEPIIHGTSRAHTVR